MSIKNGPLRAKKTNDFCVLWGNGTAGIYSSAHVLLVEFNLHSQAFNLSYGDWFLPSYDELMAMYNELHLEGISLGSHNHMSSSEYDATRVWGVEFGTGDSFLNNKAWTSRCHFCRVFEAGIGAYNLRDIGPAGGYIFHVAGDTLYYEASPLSYSPLPAWTVTNVAIGTTSTAIGTGAQNTMDIVNQAGHIYSTAQEALDHASDATLHDSSKSTQNGIVTGVADYAILRSERYATTTPSPGTTAPPPDMYELTGIKVISGSDPTGLAVVMISNTNIAEGQPVSLQMLNYVESKGS